jgi:hypothetical protein
MSGQQHNTFFLPTQPTNITTADKPCFLENLPAQNLRGYRSSILTTPITSLRKMVCMDGDHQADAKSH